MSDSETFSNNVTATYNVLKAAGDLGVPKVVIASSTAAFGFIYALTRGGPGNATEIIGIYIYNQSFTAFQLGYGAAVAVVILLVSVAIGLVYVRALKVQV